MYNSDLHQFWERMQCYFLLPCSQKYYIHNFGLALLLDTRWQKKSIAIFPQVALTTDRDLQYCEETQLAASTILCITQNTHLADCVSSLVRLPINHVREYLLGLAILPVWIKLHLHCSNLGSSSLASTGIPYKAGFLNILMYKYVYPSQWAASLTVCTVPIFAVQ